jgi:hypothetical protein
VKTYAFSCFIVLLTFAPFAAPSWIEHLTGWAPDGRNGSLERSVAAVLLTLAFLFLALAAMKRRAAAHHRLRPE